MNCTVCNDTGIQHSTVESLNSDGTKSESNFYSKCLWCNNGQMLSEQFQLLMTATKQFKQAEE